MSIINVEGIKWPNHYTRFSMQFLVMYTFSVISNIHGRKMQFLQIVQVPYPRNRFLVTFLNAWSCPWTRLVISCYYIQRGVLWRKNELSSWSQQKVIQFPAKVQNLQTLGHLGPPSKSIFSTYRQNFEKSLGRLLVTLCWILSFLSLLASVDGSGFASRHFPKSVKL